MNDQLYFTDLEGKEYPIALTRLVPARGFSLSPGLVVDECPFCHKVHRHSLSSLDGSIIYGKRESDCFCGEYILVDKGLLDQVRSKFHLK